MNEHVLAPKIMKMASIWGPFGDQWLPKERFFAFWGARARTCAHGARASAILNEFGCPGWDPKVRLRHGARTSGGLVKQHFAPLGHNFAWVFAHLRFLRCVPPAKQLTKVSCLF